ncbi:LemA family protein [Patescibacteria group bacterium]|nr:LemA family protein [Patescibacteria group bacterium]
MSYLLILLVIVGGLAAFAVVIYNSVIKLRNKTDEAWSDIDTQLKRRYDLIPNLVETVKGYASHEAGTLEKVVAARTAAMNAEGVQAKEEAENMLSNTLKSIFALAENYPELKANQNFLDLQKTLKEIEEHIQLSRRYYNANVRDFNTKIQTFPNNLFAGIFHFVAREFFQANDEEKQNVKVSFNSDTAETTEAPAAAPETPATAVAQAEAASDEAPAEEAPPSPQPATPPQPEQPTPVPETPTEPAQPEQPTAAPETPKPEAPEAPAEPAPETPAPMEQPVAPTETPATPPQPAEPTTPTEDPKTDQQPPQA